MTTKGVQLATFLIDLSRGDMQRRLGDALAVYVDAMRYPRGTEDQRASMWIEHSRREGWRAVAAVEIANGQAPTPEAVGQAPMVGIAYGYCGAPDQWWQQQVVQGLRRAGLAQAEIGHLMNSYFELTELHIHPRAQGRDSARRWRVDCSRAAARVMCCCPPPRSPVKQPGLATVPASRIHRRDPGPPLRRRPAGLCDPWPAVAVAGLKLVVASGTMATCAHPQPAVTGLPAWSPWHIPGGFAASRRIAALVR